TRMIRFPVLEGRWLVSDDVDAVVLTQQVVRQVPTAKIGDRILLSIDGRPTEWRLVGVVMEVGGGGAYVRRGGLAQESGSAGTGRVIRVVAAEERDRIIRAAERALDEARIGVERSMPLDRLYVA